MTCYDVKKEFSITAAQLPHEPRRDVTSGIHKHSCNAILRAKTELKNLA